MDLNLLSFSYKIYVQTLFKKKHMLNLKGYKFFSPTVDGVAALPVFVLVFLVLFTFIAFPGGLN